MLDFAIIDAHIHLLDQGRFGYSWAAGAPAFKRDWTPLDWATASFSPSDKRKLFRDNAVKV